MSLCYSSKIAKLGSLKSDFVVCTENLHADFSLKKKLIRGQVLCTVHGSLSQALQVESKKTGRQEHDSVHVHTRTKLKHPSNYWLLPASGTKVKLRNGSNRHTHPFRLWHGPEGFRKRISIPGSRTKQLFLERIPPHRDVGNSRDTVSLRKTFFPV